ncbi:MAG TPA: CoA ester lyase [Candidatus Baltobacterales bacterium]|nr:CoA ester lyase [Candidatus Baltobacterales bacterium]
MPETARRVRSWLFAPGHDSKLLARVFECGADEVLLDLEDAVPPQMKVRARQMVAEVAAARRCWVRVNRPTTDECANDLAALEGMVAGFRLPKVESAADVAWVVLRAPGIPLDCTIESARGVLNVHEIAASPGCALMSLGGIDLAVDLGIGRDEASLDYARSAIAIATRAAGKPPPSDGIHPRLQDDEGLRLECEAARRLGFFGKSAIHPRQVPIINQAFSPTASELAWAERVLAAFDASGGAATRLADGEFVDLPVAERARLIRSLR